MIDAIKRARRGVEAKLKTLNEVLQLDSEDEETVTVDTVIESWESAAERWKSAAEVCQVSVVQGSVEDCVLARAKEAECRARAAEAKLRKREMKDE